MNESETYEGEIIKWVDKSLYFQFNRWGGKPTHGDILSVEGLAEGVANKLRKKHPNNTFEVIKVKLMLGGI